MPPSNADRILRAFKRRGVVFQEEDRRWRSHVRPGDFEPHGIML